VHYKGSCVGDNTTAKCTPHEICLEEAAACPYDCYEPNATISGIQKKDEFCTYEDCMVFYPCPGQNNTFQYHGGGNMTCKRSESSWKPAGPIESCKRKCLETPAVPANASIVSRSADCYFEGCMYSMNCHAGYEGGGSLICGANGVWTWHNPWISCVRFCGVPIDQAHSHVAFTCDTADCVATYSCDNEYNGGGQKICDADTGVWDGDALCLKNTSTQHGMNWRNVVWISIASTIMVIGLIFIGLKLRYTCCPPRHMQYVKYVPDGMIQVDKHL